jgi:RsiW-degrading membrane proteinase PrsW (M82 family)
MNNVSGPQSTQQQAQQRQQKQLSFYFFLSAFALLIAINIVWGCSVHGCMVPVAALVGIFTTALGAELFLTSPRRVVPPALIDQELEWLLGSDKVPFVTPLEFVFAQERIRRRRAARWRFVLLTMPILVLIAYLMFMVIMFDNYSEPGAAALVVCVIAGLLLLLVRMFVQAFPTRWILARQEPGALASLPEEFHTIRL